MKTKLLVLLALLFTTVKIQAQFVLDCACIAQHASLTVTNCQATIPDICALTTNCFRSTIQPPPPLIIVQCSQTPAVGTPVGPGTHAITITVTVAGMAPIQCLVPFTVVAPITGPFSLQCAPDKTVNCDAQWGFDPPTVINPCCPNAALPNGGATVSVVSTVTNGVCPQVITRAWRAVDQCGQSAICSQTVTVVDNVPPTINCGPNQTVNCGTPWNFSTPTYSDNCTAASDLVLTIVSTVTNGVCPQVITRTWKVADLCGNSTTCAETVTVVDGTPPMISCGPNQTVNCGTAWNFSTPTYSDNCTPQASLVLSIVSTTSSGSCPEVITRVWQVTDLCGNKAICTETVTVVDTIPPTLTCAPNKTVECGTTWTFDTPTATDNCSGSAGTPSVTITVVSTVTNGTCPEIITRTWTATDACGNISAPCSPTVTVRDTTPPTLDCRCLTNNAALPPIPLTVTNCTGTIPDLCPYALACASDNCGPLTCAQTPPAGTIVGPGVHPITVTITDCAGNTVTCNLRFTVVTPAGGCCVPPPAGMVAWWPLDELNGATIYSDFSANGNTAIVESGGPLGSAFSPVAAPGMVAGSSYFIDNSTRGRAPNSGTLNFGSGSFSMDCWFWPVDQGPFNRWQPFIDKFDPANLLGYTVGITNFISGPNNFGRVAIMVGDGAASVYYSVATVNFSAWNFVGIIVDRAANTVRFNLNGVLEPAIPLTLGGSINNSLDLLIGATQVGLNVTETRLDEIELFARALNPGELAALWAANASGKCKTNCLPQVRVWNTGASGGTLLAPGTPDPNYVLVSAPPGGCTGPAQVLGGGLPGVWVANGPNSQWIGAGPTVNCQEGVYHYRRCFYLPCTDGASVIGQWAADDNAAMFLNGQPTGNTIPSIQYPNLPGYGWFPVSITNGFVCGFNCLDFYVTNANIGVNPTGFRAELTNVFSDCCVCTNIVNCACDFVNGDFSAAVPVNATGGGWTSYDVFAGDGWQATGGNPGGTFLLNNVGDPLTDPTIEQRLCCLTPGQCYTIRGQRKVQAWFGQTQPSFAVLVDGAPILVLPVPSNPANANWYPFTATFTATNKCQTIAFAAEYGGSDVSYWIDNITLECCQTNPCPVSITCPPDINLDICGPQEVVTYPLPAASSSCGLAIVSVICTPPSGSLFNLGVTTVNCVATDAQGNTAACSFTVTLRPDTTPPVINCACVQAAIPPRVNACSYTVPNLCLLQNCFSDNCTQPGLLACAQSPPAGTVLPAGASYVITLTVTDAAGNVSDPCTVGVSVIAPTDTRVWNTGMGGPSGNVPLSPGVTDPNFALASFPSGGCPGPAQVIDPSGIPGSWVPNTALSQWIGPAQFVNSCLDGVYHYRLRFNLACTNGASIAGRIAADDIGVIHLNGAPTGIPLAGFTGWTPVSITSGFVNGPNVLDIYVTNSIIYTGLRAELTNSFNCCCPESIVLNCPRSPLRACVCGDGLASVPFNVIGTSRCSPDSDSVTVVCVPPSPGPFPVGTTVVTCTATDTLGNTTSCSFPVIVATDTMPPVITCPGPITRVLCANSVAVYYKAKAKDDCSPTVGINCVPPSGTVFNVGTTIVTCSATDACGNSSSCSFPVTVINNLIWQLLPSGINDCYAQSGFEPNSPGACLITAYGASFWKNYDVTTVNRKVGHTWNFPPAWNILAAQLATRARPPIGSCDGISDNDSFSLGLNNCATPAWLWSRYLGSGNASPGLVNRQWCYASGGVCDHAFNLNLAALPLTPSGTVSLLPHMNSADRLDLLFQDDTTVDYANLRIQRCAPTHVIGGLGAELLNARIAYGPAVWCIIRDIPTLPAAGAMLRLGDVDGARLPIDPLVLADHPGSAFEFGGGAMETANPPRLALGANAEGTGEVRLNGLPTGVPVIDLALIVGGVIVQEAQLPASDGMLLATFATTEPFVEFELANGNELLGTVLFDDPDAGPTPTTLRVRMPGYSGGFQSALLRATGIEEVGVLTPELSVIRCSDGSKPPCIRESPTRPSANRFAASGASLMEISGNQAVVNPLYEGGAVGMNVLFDPTAEFRAVVPSPFGSFGPVPSNAVFSTVVLGLIDQDDDGDGIPTRVEGEVDRLRFTASSDSPFTFDFEWSSARIHPARKIYWVYGPAGASRLEFPGNSNVVVNLAELPVMQGKLGGRTPCRRLHWPRPVSLRVAGQTFEATELRVLVETDNYPVRALTGLRLEAEGAESLMLSGLELGPDEYRLDPPELTPDGLLLRWSGFGGLLEEAIDVLGSWSPTPGQFEQTQGEVLTPHDPAARLKVFRVRGQ